MALLFSIGLLLGAAGSAAAISGMAAPGPAVRAQYADDETLVPGAKEAHPEVTTVLDLMKSTTPRVGETARDVAETRAETVRVAERVARAVPKRRTHEATISTTSEYGSATLLAGLSVLTLAGLLRWRRQALNI